MMPSVHTGRQECSNLATSIVQREQSRFGASHRRRHSLHPSSLIDGGSNFLSALASPNMQSDVHLHCRRFAELDLSGILSW
jgi:hypothetical protein